MVELMVAITISLLLLAGVIQIFLASRQTYTLQDGMSRLQENARYALERISQDISRTAYLGCADSAELQEMGGPLFNSLSNTAGVYDFSTPISGGEGTGIDNTDTLVVRYGTTSGIRLLRRLSASEPVLEIDTTSPDYASLEQFDLLTVSDCEKAVVIMITNDPVTSGGIIQDTVGVTATSGPNMGQSNANNVSGSIAGLSGANFSPTDLSNSKGSLASAFRTSVVTYLVGPSISGNGNSLYANSITADNELIQGVQDFQVLYGVNDDGDLGADRYVNANNVVTAITGWDDVVSVRITLVLDTVDPVQGGQTIAKTFTTTVRLRNRGDTILGS